MIAQSQRLEDLHLLKDDLKEVAVEIIEEFGSIGTLKVLFTGPDPITGEGGEYANERLRYFREFYDSRELVENLILNGDAKLYITRDSKPETSCVFVDDSDVEWGIVSVTTVAAQGGDIIYLIQIRK